MTDRHGSLAFVEERTATYNRLRDLMAEFGIVLPQKLPARSTGAHLEDLLETVISRLDPILFT